jgi:hypothetical protein
MSPSHTIASSASSALAVGGAVDAGRGEPGVPCGVRHPAGPGTHDDELRDDPCCGLADGAVTRIGQVAELEHLAEDGNGTSGQAREQSRGATIDGGDAL